MTQHFLLRAESRTLSLKDIYKGGEDAAYETFKQLRWENGEPSCPKCGAFGCYEIKTRRRFKCKGCFHQFSVTSGTIFASRKMDFTDLMAAICIVVNASKGLSAVQLSRDLDVQYKTAWVLAHKLREAMAAEVEKLTLEGEVEIDGAYFGGYVRPRNYKEDRIDRRLRENRNDKKQVVIAIRQRGGRTRTFVRKSEAEGVEIAHRVVSRKSVIYADEGPWWDKLHIDYIAQRINHSEAYSDMGTNTNSVESLFSRMRRMVAGQHHGVSGKYLHQYAAHTGWLEDHRRRSNGANTRGLIGSSMKHPVSRNWKGYWQRSA